MTAKPWIKWYLADFSADPKLCMCCRAARSFWHDMLRLMNEAEPYGHLVVNGHAPTTKELARSLGDVERDAARWLAELERNGVFSRTRDGVIYSRRMVRDHVKAERDKENGKAGGSPILKAKANGGDNPNDKAQKLEVRDQNQKPETTKSNAESEKTGESVGRSKPRDPAPRNQRWPKDAIISEQWKQDAAIKLSEHGLNNINLDLEADKFVNWALGAGKAKADWRRTWVNWALREAKEHGGQATRQPGRAGADQTRKFLTDIFDAAEELDAAAAVRGQGLGPEDR